MNKYLIVSLVMLSLTACSSDSDLRYLDTRATVNLEIPPDLTSATLNEKFEIPSNFSAGLSETINKIPVLARVDSIRLAGSEDFYWLEVDGEVDNLYQTIKSFWASEGFVLDIDEPVIGIIQTKWVFKEEGVVDEDKGFFADLFSSDDFSTSQDQFRTRISRESSEKVTRIYISHRGTEYKRRLESRQTESDKLNDWAFRDPEPELEIEMLSRLMVFLGLDQSDVDQQVSRVKLFAPRASMHTDSSESETYILVRAVKQLAWNRLLHELDRLDVDILSANPSIGFSGAGMVSVNTLYEIEQKSSGLFSLFSSTESKLTKKQVTLVVSKETHDSTRISIENSEGEVDDSSEAIEFLTMLYKHIR
ncbi:MAG: outer membrane protein assembly factor BamC [Gammaproteobacteria bacterium]|nr:outer membrane protein assembly factor BamC [Gammaproteobacteria bacterium]